ncbi:hypothetical protein DN402_12430 [Streptomyces sp. SW4]|nr:hypothetical protein DN402_12430 [Streptomyces sp. SW4]
MSGLGELDRPGPPAGAGAWDERSRAWLETSAPRDQTSALRDQTSAPRNQRSAQRDQVSAPRDQTSAPREPGGGQAPASAGRGGAGAPAGGRPAARRSGADPVKALMHRHRDLCERAVDPLEIAAGLEAHGVTDRTAARFRHRDVFSLAEEMFARVPRDGDTAPRPAPTPREGRGRRAHAGWIALALLPGALCAAAITALWFTDGQSRLVVAAVAVLAVPLGLRAALRRGPLSTGRTRPDGHPGWTVGWLLGYALLGDGLLRAALGGGPDELPTGAPDGPWPVATASAAALALGLAPATWCAHLFIARARRRLTTSRGLRDFSASVRPLLLGTVALFLGTLAGLLALTGTVLDQPAAYPQVLTLGALLLLARLLTVHGFTHAPALVLTAAATVEATALATLFTARLPGCGFLAVPVEALVTAWGPGAVPTAACGLGALALLLHAVRRLTSASAHAPTDHRR